MPGTRHQAAPTPPRRSTRERRQTTFLHVMVSTDPMAQMTPDSASATPAPNPHGTTVDSGEDSGPEDKPQDKQSRSKRKGKAKEEDDEAEGYLDVSWQVVG